MVSVSLFGGTNQAEVTSQENTEKEKNSLASPRPGKNNSNTKPRFVEAFLQTTISAKKQKKQRQFWFGDAMTSSWFLVIGHRAPAKVSFAGTSIKKKNIGI